MDTDLCIIGGGPGGYNAAIRAGQLGQKVIIIEKRTNHGLGGTCLYEGCIPSKILLNSSLKLYEAENKYSELGINFSKLTVDQKQMHANKDKTIAELKNGIDYLMKKYKVTKLYGHANFVSPKEVVVKDGNGKEQKINAKNYIIATGSVVSSLPGIKIDEKNILSSTGALNLSQAPKDLLVIGGGVIGVELGSVFARLGTKVTIVEFFEQLIPSLDSEVARGYRRILEKQNLQIMTAHKVLKTKLIKDKINVTIENIKNNDVKEYNFTKLLMAVGRKPYTDKLGLENTSVELDKQGFIITDNFYTGCENIYAIGDVTTGPMLAHKAEEEAVACVENLCGKAGHVDYNLIPSVIYTEPEIATIGLNEEQCKEQKISYKKAKFNFAANSRAKATGHSEGVVKILAHSQTDKVLGCHIMGSEAGELIAEIAVLMSFQGSSEDLARICHAHPTKSEAVRQAAMGIDNWTMQS